MTAALAFLLALALIPAKAVAEGTVLAPYLTWNLVPSDATYAELAASDEKRAKFEALGVTSVELAYRVRMHVHADGKITSTTTRVHQFIGRDGLHEEGNQSLWIDAFLEKGTIEEAYTILPGGEKVEADPGAVQLLSDTDDDIFTDSFKAIIPFPALAPNSVTVLRYRSEVDSTQWPLPWSRIYYPQTFDHRSDFDLRITWDAGSWTPQVKTSLDSLNCISSQPREYACRARDLEPYPTDPDVSYYDKLPSLVIAQQVTWGELGRRESALVETAMAPEAAVRDLLDFLLAGSTSEHDKLSRLHRFVSEEVRYLGLELGLGGIVPRSAVQTLKRRYGDCKDKVALFISLARHAGFDAYPVLTTFKRFDDGNLLLPAAAYFDHMVACASLKDGQERCVDLTDRHTAPGDLSYSLHGAVRLALRDAPSQPDTFPAEDHLWQLDVASVIELSDDGAILETLIRTYKGPYAAYMRAGLRTRDVASRNEWARNQYHDQVSDQVDPTFEFQGVDEIAEPVIIRSTARYDSAFDPQTLESYRELQPWLSLEVRSGHSENTQHPFRFPGIRVTGEVLFKLPPGRRLQHSAPRIQFESGYGHFLRRSEPTGNGLRVTTDLDLPQRLVPTDDIQRFNRFLDYINDQALIRFVLTDGEGG